MCKSGKKITYKNNIVDKVARLFFTTPFFDIFIDLRVERISRTHPRMQIFCSYD